MYNQEKPPEQQPPQNYGQPPAQGYGAYGGYQGYPNYPQAQYQQGSQGSSAIVDYLLFRRMITVVIIQVIFWLGVIAVMISGIALVADGSAGLGLLTIIFGPIVVRIYCEVLIIIFRINETLTEIKNALNRR